MIYLTTKLWPLMMVAFAIGSYVGWRCRRAERT